MTPMILGHKYCDLLTCSEPLTSWVLPTVERQLTPYLYPLLRTISPAGILLILTRVTRSQPEHLCQRIWLSTLLLPVFLGVLDQEKVRLVRDESPYFTRIDLPLYKDNHPGYIVP